MTSVEILAATNQVLVFPTEPDRSRCRHVMWRSYRHRLKKEISAKLWSHSAASFPWTVIRSPPPLSRSALFYVGCLHCKQFCCWVAECKAASLLTCWHVQQTLEQQPCVFSHPLYRFRGDTFFTRQWSSLLLSSDVGPVFLNAYQRCVSPLAGLGRTKLEKGDQQGFCFFLSELKYFFYLDCCFFWLMSI